MEHLLRRLRPLSAVAAVTAAALVLVGCGGGSGSGSGNAGKGQAASATENDINAVDRSKLASGGDPRWPPGGLPPNYNYNQLDGALDDNNRVISALMPYAFDFSADSTPSVNKDYFANIELTSEDPQVVTYDINPKATWSDGTPITAEDLIAQWKAVNGTNPAYNIAASNGYEDISKVEQGTSEKQAVVTFSNAYADWKALYTPLYPASTNNDPNLFNTGWTEKPLVTAGPFRLQGIDTTPPTNTPERNPPPWGGKGNLHPLIHPVISLHPPVRAP